MKARPGQRQRQTETGGHEPLRARARACAAVATITDAITNAITGAVAVVAAIAQAQKPSLRGVDAPARARIGERG